jgi:hypothetical protein
MIEEITKVICYHCGSFNVVKHGLNLHKGIKKNISFLKSFIYASYRL